MRFELSVALKYLIPRWRQLSVSVISLISILVISLVVWLVLIFLSVTDGIEKKWIEELVALNAPVRLTPTEAYYDSYYYQIDKASADSNYTPKTIGEKLTALRSDPYDPQFDMELPPDFPTAERSSNGDLKDPVKEAFAAIKALSFNGLRAKEYEIGLGNLRIEMLRGDRPGGQNHVFLTQLSYIASHDEQNKRVKQMVLPPSADDFNNLISSLGNQAGGVKTNLNNFFSNIQIEELETTDDSFVLHSKLLPKVGSLKGLGLLRYGQIVQVIIPQNLEQLSSLQARLGCEGREITSVEIVFEGEQLHVRSSESHTVSPHLAITLSQKCAFKATLVPSSLENAQNSSSLAFHIEGKLQKLAISGIAHYEHLAIKQASWQLNSAAPLWVHNCQEGGCTLPVPKQGASLGQPLLVSKQFQKNGVRLGDRGYLSYYAEAGSSMQEQRMGIYIAGFYDPGMVPVGNKLIFANPHTTAVLRGSTQIADPMLGNGVNIWLDNLAEASEVKESLVQALKDRDIDHYWNVQSFHDYEFTRPILQQLQSDRNLFTLIAIIILIVACSNIISMLILLVNDKKRQIGILQSMGASPISIALIFGLCGFITGLISCIVGVAAAIFTLNNLQSLVSFLSFLQGKEAFQAAFYGSSLPNEISYSALVLVFAATLVISLLAGIVPAIKAARINPTDTLRTE